MPIRKAVSLALLSVGKVRVWTGGYAGKLVTDGLLEPEPMTNHVGQGSFDPATAAVLAGGPGVEHQADEVGLGRVLVEFCELIFEKDRQVRWRCLFTAVPDWIAVAAQDLQDAQGLGQFKGDHGRSTSPRASHKLHVLVVYLAEHPNTDKL